MTEMARVFGVSLCVVLIVAACSGSDVQQQSVLTEMFEEFEEQDGGVGVDASGVDPVEVVVVTEEELLAAMGNDEVVAAGEATFNAFNSCASCHGINGSGAFGPALDDGVWVYGESPMEIYEVIRDGLPSQGMPGHGHLDAGELVGLTAYLAGL